MSAPCCGSVRWGKGGVRLNNMVRTYPVAVVPLKREGGGRRGTRRGWEGDIAEAGGRGKAGANQAGAGKPSTTK